MKVHYLGHGADLRHVPGLACVTERAHQIPGSTVTDFLAVDRHRLLMMAKKKNVLKPLRLVCFVDFDVLGTLEKLKMKDILSFIRYIPRY